MSSQEELKKEALLIKNEKEYNEKIKQLHQKGLIMDEEILKHFDSIMPPAENGIDGDI